jgi:hypothetical protein
MTRKEKRDFKLKRAAKRREKRMAKYVEKIRKARSYGMPPWISLHAACQGVAWPDDSSPTGYYQVCDYQGICQHPCNGDC